jgi:hypothetical protein
MMARGVARQGPSARDSARGDANPECLDNLRPSTPQPLLDATILQAVPLIAVAHHVRRRSLKIAAEAEVHW